jgi:hypothetical protein
MSGVGERSDEPLNPFFAKLWSHPTDFHIPLTLLWELSYTNVISFQFVGRIWPREFNWHLNCLNNFKDSVTSLESHPAGIGLPV